MDNSSIEKKNENNNINYSSLKEDNNNNIKDNEICNIYTIEDNYNNSIIDKKLPSLSELEIEEEKINKTISNMDHYRKIKPSIHKKKKPKNIKNRKFDTIHNSKSINNREQKINIIDCDNLISFPSPTLHKEFDKNQLISNTSYGNFEHNEFQNKSFARSTNIIPHARFILSPNNLRNASENCVPISNNTYSYGRKEILYNQFKPKNAGSLELEGKKNYFNFKYNSIKNNNYNNKNLYIDRNNITYKNNYKKNQFNSIGLVDNSISTNFCLSSL
jgi:hypothetical protein